MGNYKSASGQLQNSGQFQNNSVNGAMLITINCVIKKVMSRVIYLHLVWIPLKYLFACDFYIISLYQYIFLFFSTILTALQYFSKAFTDYFLQDSFFDSQVTTKTLKTFLPFTSLKNENESQLFYWII